MRRSRRLIRQAEENQASIQEALELSVVGQSSDRESNSGDKSDTSAKDTTTTEEDIGAVSSDDFWYDTSNQELICVDVSPVTPTSASNQDPETWSSVNRFFPDGCVLSPPIRPLGRAVSLPALATAPSESVVNSGVIETVYSNSEESDSPPSPALTVIDMDPFNAQFKVLKKSSGSIDILIQRFNPETVSILDKDDYKVELKTIFDYLLKMQDKVADLQDSLDDSIEAHRKLSDDVNTLLTATSNKVVHNETAVKKQMLKLINESASTSTLHAADIENKESSFLRLKMPLLDSKT